MIEIIKDFLAYRKAIKAFNNIKLTDTEKSKLANIDKELLVAVYNVSVNNLTREMLDDNLSAEYIRGWKQGITVFLSHFRNYNQK